MANYKLIKVAKKIEGNEVQSIYDYTDDMDALIAAMNNDFGVMVKDPDVVSVYCVAINNDNGAKVESFFWAMPRFTTDPESGEPIENDISIRPRVYTHNDYAADNIAAYENEKLATGNFHTKKAAAINKSECNHAITILLDGSGKYLEFSNWTRQEQ